MSLQGSPSISCKAKPAPKPLGTPKRDPPLLRGAGHIRVRHAICDSETTGLTHLLFRQEAAGLMFGRALRQTLEGPLGVPQGDFWITIEQSANVLHRLN